MARRSVKRTVTISGCSVRTSPTRPFTRRKQIQRQTLPSYATSSSRPDCPASTTTRLPILPIYQRVSTHSSLYMAIIRSFVNPSSCSTVLELLCISTSVRPVIAPLYTTCRSRSKPFPRRLTRVSSHAESIEHISL